MGRCAGAEAVEEEGAGTVGGKNTHSSAGGAAYQLYSIRVVFRRAERAYYTSFSPT